MFAAYPSRRRADSKECELQWLSKGDGVIRPPRLQPGDTVGLVSPSWGGAGLYPHRVERGVQHLQSLGFKVRNGL